MKNLSIPPALVLLTCCLAAWSADVSYDPGFAPFDPDYRDKALGVRIVLQQEAQSEGMPTALVRLPNRKLALMVRDRSGRLQPFYPRGLATGYWSRERPTREYYEQVFTDFQQLGANTVMLGIHWRDIEPEEGRFDFRYTDMVVETAEKFEVKVWWVLFMHFQPNNWPEPGLEDFWVYNLDSRDGADYAVQWLRDDKGNVLKTISALLENRIEVAPSYSHPAVFPRVLRMLQALGDHYRTSRTVTATQIGNEEGFMTAPWREQDLTRDWQTDVNPVTLGLFANWKSKTGKSDWFSFKLDIVNYWWTMFTSAYHRGDPHKLTSFNLMTGGPEAGAEWWIQQEGVDAATYRDGNVDVIGTMFHRPFGDKIWANLDKQYSYVYEPPILIPSEIGIGRSLQMFQQYTLNTIERGGQGYAVWSYSRRSLFGEDGSLSDRGSAFQRLASMVAANEDIIHPGLPGAGDVSIRTLGEAKVSQLHAEAGTLGILYFPKPYDLDLGPQDWDQQKAISLWREQHPDAYGGQADVTVEIQANRPGNYSVEVFRNGEPRTATTQPLRVNATHSLTIEGFAETEAIFIRVTRPQ